MNSDLFYFLLFVLCGYLAGSLPFALIISHFKKLSDPREAGSGNAGATNMLRLHGKSVAAVTLLGDIAKGFLVVWLYISEISSGLSSGQTQNTTVTAIALSVILGHIFPIFFGFKGGKGVATMLGVMLAASFYLALFTFGCWLVSLLITRISGYAALITAFISPIVAWILNDAHLLLWVACSMVLFMSHRSNIRHLIRSIQSSH